MLDSAAETPVAKSRAGAPPKLPASPLGRAGAVRESGDSRGAGKPPFGRDGGLPSSCCCFLPPFPPPFGDFGGFTVGGFRAGPFPPEPFPPSLFGAAVEAFFIAVRVAL